MGDSHMGKDPNGNNGPWQVDASKSYALSGKIMLTAIIILFFVVILLVVLHLYARWYLLRVRRRYLNRRRSTSGRRLSAAHHVFYVDPSNPNSTTATVPARGLDASVLNSLPVFVFSPKAHHDDPLECAVCLSEFEENEHGRILPKCHHTFHTDCINMWFHSHSTCPLCRSPVEPPPVQVNNTQPDVVISVGEPAESEPGLTSGLVVEQSESETTSLAGRRKGLNMVGVTIEVPRRNELDDESRLSSLATSQGFRSPGSRLLSLKRILSMNRRGTAVSPSPGVGTSYGAVGTESDLEASRHESTQGQTRAPTPR